MRKLGLFVIGLIAALVLLANVGPLVGMVVSLVFLYFGFKGFMKAETTGKKVLWGLLALVALTIAVANVPAILAVVAGYVLYLVYKKWNRSEDAVKEKSDPFTNFEKEWAQLKKNF
ncbi:lmo0954 family membrane protein [Litchfieldia alkalitelluris]|uniref:lmo0954 family membrane protein n=1 Tax=Litchfieldia alkalitelluris TaxID=304268 RepID=UPI0009987F95|nr:flagellar basal body rod protein [Litchfieldia alkalitelluris]